MAGADSPSAGTRVSAFVLVASVCAALGWLGFFVTLAHSHGIGGGGLFPDDHPFTDFYLYKPTFDAFHSSGFFRPIPPTSRFAYPPLVAPLYRFFYSHQHRLSWYLLFTGLVWAVLLAWVAAERRNMRLDRLGKLAIVLAATLSYPAVFLLERGNLELFVWMSVAAGIYLFVRGKQSAAAICFGFGAALKLYPILLLGLFLREKRGLRSVAIGITAAAASTLWALWYAGPTIGIAAHGFLGGITGFQQHYGNVVRSSELGFDHSFFSVWKVLAASHPEALPGLSRLYYGLCALCFTAFFFIRVVRLPLLNRLLFLSVAMIVLPPVSYEYTLVHLYVPVLLLVVSAHQFRSRTAGQVALVAALLLLVPTNLLRGSEALQAGQIQALLLLLLAGCASFPLCRNIPANRL